MSRLGVNHLFVPAQLGHIGGERGAISRAREGAAIVETGGPIKVARLEAAEAAPDQTACLTARPPLSGRTLRAHAP